MPNSTIQKLADAWAARPRRQIEFENVEDLEWLNDLCKALIPAMPEIQDKFEVRPTPIEAPIILQMPPPTSAVPPPARGLPLSESNVPQTAPVAPAPSQSEIPASRKVRSDADGGDDPNKLQASKPEKGRNIRIPRSSRSKAGISEVDGQTKGRPGKPEVAAAKPTVAPEVSVPTAAPSNLPPAMQKLAGDDAPPPKLTPIG